MSKRILIAHEGFKHLDDVYDSQSILNYIRVYGRSYYPCTGLYAVIIADDNLFEGL